MGAARLRDLCAGNPDVMAWIEEHGLNPSDVAMGEHLSPVLDDDHMTVLLYRKDSDGFRYVDPATNDVAVDARTVALLRQPPNLHATDGSPLPATEPA